MKRDPQTYAIIGVGMEVHRVLGPGFLEQVYQEAFEHELVARGVAYQREVEIPVLYKGRKLACGYRADFICLDGIIVELKAVSQLTDDHRAQVMNYLKATGFKLGILVNFGHHPRIETMRIVADDKWSDRNSEPPDLKA